MVLGTGHHVVQLSGHNYLFILPVWNAVVSLLDRVSQWETWLRFIVLFLLAVDCRKVKKKKKNVLFEAIKHKMNPISLQSKNHYV